MKKTVFFLSALFVLTAFTTVLTTWKNDPPHSQLGFTVTHLGISDVSGTFNNFNVAVTSSKKDFSDAVFDLTAEIGSIDTRVEQRNNHLKSADFFDVEKYPSITFKSTRVDKAGDGLKIVGDLTIHGATQQVVLDAEMPSAELKDPWGNTKIGASASTKIKRKDFGLTWNAALEAGGFLVGDDVTIQLDVQFVKQA